jgi:hypothetical protein
MVVLFNASKKEQHMIIFYLKKYKLALVTHSLNENAFGLKFCSFKLIESIDH